MCGDTTCWICMDDNKGGAERLCNCPRVAHKDCMAIWQIQSYGKGEETRCRFCNACLPDWRGSVQKADSRPLRIGLHYMGKVHVVTYDPVVQTWPEFKKYITKKLRLPKNALDVYDVKFTVNVNIANHRMHIDSIRNFDDAVKCALAKSQE